jgi:hypothetical protein
VSLPFTVISSSCGVANKQTQKIARLKPTLIGMIRIAFSKDETRFRLCRKFKALREGNWSWQVDSFPDFISGRKEFRSAIVSEEIVVEGLQVVRPVSEEMRNVHGGPQ